MNRIFLCAPLLLSLAVPAAVSADQNDLKNVVYIQSNNPFTHQNSVLAYRRNATTGALTEISGSPFLTGGTGFYNNDERLGPDDTDHEIVVTPDQRFLYVVNQGSNSISGFAIHSNGSLSAVPGSPFASNGYQPGSLTVDGIALFVVNRGDQNPGGTGGSHAPNYSGFLILPEGSLVPLPWSQNNITPGSSPTQLADANGGTLLFDTHLFENPLPPAVAATLPPFVPPYSSTIHSYRVNLIGQLIQTDTTQPPAGIPPFILGMAVHPSKKILYTGYVLAGGVGAYAYDNDGNLTLNGTAFSTSGSIGQCWLITTPDGKTLYAADAVTDQIDIYSLADALHPAFVKSVDLKGPKTALNDPAAPTVFDTTPFQMGISPDGKFLYVVNHEATLANNEPEGNAVHILAIGPNGGLTETAASPLVFPVNEVPANAHPLGIVVF